MSRNGNDLLCVSFVNYEFVCVFSLLFTRLQPHLLSNLTENVWINDLVCTAIIGEGTTCSSLFLENRYFLNDRLTPVESIFETNPIL